MPSTRRIAGVLAGAFAFGLLAPWAKSGPPNTQQVGQSCRWREGGPARDRSVPRTGKRVRRHLGGGGCARRERGARRLRERSSKPRAV